MVQGHAHRGGQKDVDARWTREESGDHYQGGRWRGSRAKERDPRMIARLIGRLRTGEDQGRVLERVLDAPSGTGRLLTGLRRLVPEAHTAPDGSGLIVEADISGSMLRAGRSADAASVGGDHQAWVQASATGLPFASDTFDLVVCCRLLHHLKERDDRARILQELVRVSRGYVIASYWDSRSYGAWRRRTRSPLRRKKRADVRSAAPWTELSAEIRAAGATVVDRAFSMRYVSQQAFFLAKKNRAR